ncbi:uncharacterized protein LOC126746846 [Anthonomus grandis grandis]|uniref:uncharacterized protein LOC126746846 n=1 Tax=Anthonomus grandis grandis TaxID=2921223 RepID=UPI0021650D4D|nr:uncharacterized protein LOC126746846 [Anthonomus grandis grandis]
MDQEESRPAVSSILDDNNIEENSHTSDTDSHTQDSTQPLDSSPVLSPATSQSSTSTSRNKRIQKSKNTWTKKKHQFLDASLKILQTETAPPHTDKEESQEITFGKNIGQQLQETEDRQKIIAQKLISDVLFYAKLGNLTDSSSISFTHQPAPCQSVSYVPPAQLYQPTYTNNVTPYTQPNAAEVYRPTYANLTSFTPPNVAQAYQPTYTNLNTPSTQSSAAQIFRQTYINHTTSTQPNSNAAGLPFTSQSEVSTPTTDAAAKTTDHVFMDEFLSFDKAKN